MPGCPERSVLTVGALPAVVGVRIFSDPLLPVETSNLPSGLHAAMRAPGTLAHTSAFHPCGMLSDLPRAWPALAPVATVSGVDTKGPTLWLSPVLPCGVAG